MKSPDSGAGWNIGGAGGGAGRGRVGKNGKHFHSSNSRRCKSDAAGLLPFFSVNRATQKRKWKLRRAEGDEETIIKRYRLNSKRNRGPTVASGK